MSKREELIAILDAATLSAVQGSARNEPFWNDFTLQVFNYQALYNPLYAKYLDLLGVKPSSVQTPDRIPFLPIELFKSYQIQTGTWEPQHIFSSSGTTGQTPSQHLLRDAEWYKIQARRAFNLFYGPLHSYTILALLPSYLERNGSSLVFMAEDFIQQSGHTLSGFYLHDLKTLRDTLRICQNEGMPVILLGVSFALLDLAEEFPMPMKNTIIMETGGMKGRREEITRETLHQILQKAFEVPYIHSEYGMTELLSQAYSKGDGRFQPGSAMKISIREVTDPLSIRPIGQTGGINITDLANLDTISFIATEDLGRLHDDGSFEVLGRMDQSEIRGCNLMVE